MYADFDQDGHSFQSLDSDDGDSQAFSQKLKVGRPRGMFLVNFLKD